MINVLELVLSSIDSRVTNQLIDGRLVDLKNYNNTS